MPGTVRPWYDTNKGLYAVSYGMYQGLVLLVPYVPRVPFVPIVPLWCAARAPHASRALCDSLGALVCRS